MATPTQINYRHVAPSDELNALIHEQVAKLDEFQDHIIECRVIIDEPNLRHREKHFRVEVVVLVSGAELIASRDPSDTQGEDAYAVVHEAFRAIRRHLLEHVERTRHETKSHPGPGHRSVA